MFGLTHPTPPSWAALAAGDLPSFLVDHAHAEMKAATSALALATRPDATYDMRLSLTAIAQEEIAHFRDVLAILEARGISLGAPAVDTYAAELRKAAVSPGDRTGRHGFVDRLLVAALIEARSCERFRLLSRELAAQHHVLAAFYEGLLASEARHYTTMVDLAVAAGGAEEVVRDRLTVLARAEGTIVARLGVRPTVHG
jgi:tRNA-(ms[2]io[6]A)-hydroxylase